MTDFRIKQTIGDSIVAVTLDLLQTPVGLLDETNPDYKTAVIIALGTDARARADDVLPDPDSGDRRGWWADTGAAEVWDGWPIGSRLWLLSRAKITGASAKEGATVARVETYVREALLPFIEKKICSRMAVSAVRNGLSRIDVDVTLYRGPKTAVALQFQALWE